MRALTSATSRRNSGNKFPTVRCVYVEPGVQDDVLETAAKVGYRFRIGRANDGPLWVKDEVRRNEQGKRVVLGVIRPGQKPAWFKPAHELPFGDKAQFGIVLRKLREDAIGTLAEMGKALGFCMCCGHPLSNQESVDRGIGPDCWEKLQ